MTLNHDELRARIREVIDERDAERMSHPERRERMTTFTGHDGVTLHSITQSRRDWIRTIAAIITAASVIAGAFNTLVVYPMIDARAQAAIKLHSAEAKKQMEEVSKRIVFRPEWERWTAEKEERWRNQAALNDEMRAALIEMNKDIKELLRRVR